MPDALEGVRVLDLTRFLPGPYCTLLLADLGAHVLRVEQPREVAKKDAVFGHDRLPQAERVRIKAQEMVARNKRSILLDLRKPGGAGVALDIAAQYDVLVHDYRPGVLEGSGLGYAEVRARNPRIVYCAITLCGQTGPYRDLPGHDPVALALSGALTRFGVDSATPAIPGTPVGDIVTGLHAAVGILAALRARETSGSGQMIDVAMSECALAMLTPIFQRYLASGRAPPQGWRAGNAGVWKTRDGRFICTTDVEPAFWRRFCESAGKPELADRASDPGRREEIEKELAALFAARTRDEWFELARAHGTQAAPVYDLGEALADPHARARGAVVEVAESGDRVVHVASPIRLSATPPRIRHLARLPGADTASVLAELGFEPDRIAAVQAEAQEDGAPAASPSR